MHKTLMILSIIFSVFLSSVVVAETTVDLSKLEYKDSVYYEQNSKKPYTGTAVEYYGNGNKRMELSFVNGRESGKMTMWFNSEQVEIEADIKNGFGFVKEYGKDGNLLIERIYKGDTSVEKFYVPDGSGIVRKEIAKKLTLDDFGYILNEEVVHTKEINLKNAESLKEINIAIQTSYYIFIDRYRKIPGDWNKDEASKKIPGVTTGGNSDGKINDGGNGIWEEALGAWEHLSKSGVLQESLANTGLPNEIYTGGNTAPDIGNSSLAPRNPFGGFMMLVRSKDYYDVNENPRERIHLILGKGIPVNILAQLDRMLDDGYPHTGVVRHSATSNAVFGELAESNPECIDTTKKTPVYNITNLEVLCNAVFLY